MYTDQYIIVLRNRLKIGINQSSRKIAQVHHEYPTSDIIQYHVYEVIQLLYDAIYNQS